MPTDLSRTLHLGGLRREASYWIGFPARNLPLPGTNAGYRRFVILSPGRSGSNMLVERCASHPEVECFGEVLHARGIWWHERLKERSHRLRRIRDAWPVHFFERHLWHRYPRGVEAVGCKILYDHFLSADKGLRDYLKRLDDLRLLYLDRRNLLAGYLSCLTALQSGVWKITREEQRLETPPLVLDPDKCRSYFMRARAAGVEVRALLHGRPSEEFFYEDLVVHPEREDRRICAFLGVADRPLTHRSKKISRGSLRSRIANFDELRSHFAGSGWARFFHE